MQSADLPVLDDKVYADGSFLWFINFHIYSGKPLRPSPLAGLTCSLSTESEYICNNFQLVKLASSSICCSIYLIHAERELRGALNNQANSVLDSARFRSN